MGTKTPFCPTLPREKPPKDGTGPRGLPDCYYTSRTLESTFRYWRFIKKLRAAEEEQRKGAELKKQLLLEKQINGFFVKCDRNSLINDVAERVKLCLASFQRDLEAKRLRLKSLFIREEEENYHRLVVQIQDADKVMWQEKIVRLQFLQGKRIKEHEEKYKKWPISKCTHVQPCIVKLRCKEAQEMQIYQMHEKQSRKMQEKEIDDMWHEISMKESDALAARLEIDAMNRYRQDQEFKEHNQLIVEQREKQREKNHELLKKEQLAMTAKFEADDRKAEQEEQDRRDKIKETERARIVATQINEAVAAKKAEDDALVEEKWSKLANQGMAADEAKIELMRRKRMELDTCNRKLLELREALNNNTEYDKLVDEIQQQKQEDTDLKRCNYVLGMQRANWESRKYMKQQIAEHEARVDLKKKIADEEQYRVGLQKQMDQLVAYQLMEEAKARKLHQQDLVKQMQYNQLLKERALQEELDQRKKAAIAAKEYQDDINAMLSRKHLSDSVHPFVKEMETATMKKCPCAAPDWCQDPQPHE